jgi:poly(3-hydroxybutyrate) depolymerase
VKGVVAREHHLDLQRLWDDFSQEETREEALQGCQAKGDEDEEIVALHAKKSRGDGKKDMRKVKYFACHKTGHYASQCQNKKKRKKETQVATSTSNEIDNFFEMLEK